MGISLGALLGLGGKPVYADEPGGERFTSWLPEDIEVAEWGPIIERAKLMGFAVKESDGMIYMHKSAKCSGRFMSAKGGHKLAEEFLNSVGGR